MLILDLMKLLHMCVYIYIYVKIYMYIYIYDRYDRRSPGERKKLLGGWTNSFEKRLEFVSWDDEIQIIWDKEKGSKPLTRYG